MILQKLLNEIQQLSSIKLFEENLIKGERQITVSGLAGSSKAMVIACIFKKYFKPMLVVTSDTDEALMMVDDLKAFLGDSMVKMFPAWGISPYEIRVPHTDLIGQRLQTLYALNGICQPNLSDPVIIVAPVEAILQKTIPKKSLEENSICIKQGQQFDRDELIILLEKLKYQRTPMTEILGEYSVRGGIIDLFIPTDENPVRIEFFGDEIDSIRHFSVLTQRSTSQTDEIILLPRREMIFEDSQIEKYAEQLEETQAQALHDVLSNSDDYDGLEFIWPNLDIVMSDIFEYLSDNMLIFVTDPDSCNQQVESIHDLAEERYNSTDDIPLAEPDQVFLTDAEFKSNLNKYQTATLKSTASKSQSVVSFQTRPQEYFSTNITYMKNRLKELYQDGYQLNILCESQGQKNRIEEIIDDIGFPISLSVSRLSSGFAVEELKKWFLTDHQIFTRHRKKRSFRRFREGIALSSYSSLNPGDYVVHIDYGIGRFGGLETIVVDGRRRDCLAIYYVGDDKLYVPVEEFGRVQKYAGKDGDPRLSKLGSGTWEKVKARTKKALMEMAGELVALYAERQAFPGYAFKADSGWMRQLETSFEYQETLDQLKAMDEIKIDMEKAVPMDRLVCGDVGYGKTELAIRASLKAVDSGKQVAVLAPTTILTAQHHTTFSERLEDFPVKVEMLSRFCTPKKVKEIKKGLTDGTVDVVIGTHKLLQKNVVFKDLGLLIVDEEQRFGVTHKEKIKKFRSEVDVLTLTATPIPRTLQLSLAGARDMSVINTPPKDRLPINTEVARFSDKIMTEAVNRELAREGQIFIVHNRVQSIYAFCNYLKRFLPSVSIGIGHGQMRERELERVMKNFLDKKYQILLSTTIIESGLDIPSVNTIIINRADKLGLAQLYQLRGRVGRSNRQAYAYLMIPPLKLLSRNARKRLKAIEEFTELGSGFHLAMRDLEIRGAGNLLGAQQHGFIEEVGFDLYIKLLEEAVAQLMGKPVEEHTSEIKINTDLDLFLPENYITESNQRVEIYRKFSGAKNSDEIDDLIQELEDRFGSVPEAVKNLSILASLRISGKKIGLKSLVLKKNKLALEFIENVKLNRENIEQWVLNIPEKMEFKYGRNFIIDISIKERDNGSENAKKILQKMAE